MLAHMRAVLLSVALFLVAASARADAVLLDGVAARVDDHIVYLSDVRERAHGQLDKPAMRAALDSIIDAILFAKRADEQHVTVSSDELRRMRENVEQRNGLTDAQFIEELHKQGMTQATWEAIAREQLLEGKVLQIEVMKEPHPTAEAEIEAWLVKRRAELVKKLRADAVIEVRL